jgi:hypothetical protein
MDTKQSTSKDKTRAPGRQEHGCKTKKRAQIKIVAKRRLEEQKTIVTRKKIERTKQT